MRFFVRTDEIAAAPVYQPVCSLSPEFLTQKQYPALYCWPGEWCSFTDDKGAEGREAHTCPITSFNVVIGSKSMSKIGALGCAWDGKSDVLGGSHKNDSETRWGFI